MDAMLKPGDHGGFYWKVFQDSVHGAVQFHPVLVRIIDSVEFQRLRYIKQLSLSYWVYPAASHNRFEHSLGVCYLAGRMLAELEEHTDGDLWRKIGITQPERLCVQIAGLCHDLGHGPFSHTWEVFLRSMGIEWHHEDASCLLFDLLVEKNEGILKEFEKFGLDKEHRVLIKDLIKGSSSDPNITLKAFLFEIVANKTNDVDVDKWDYFLRDGLNLNVKISFDLNRCLKLCKVIQKSDGKTTIAFRDNEAYSISGMFRLRADLYVRAYQHRVSKCIEMMLVDALREADKFLTFRGSDGRDYCLSEAHNDMEAFRQLTDAVHPNIQFSSSKDLEKAREICTRISKRDLYKLVGEWPLKAKEVEEGRTPRSLTQHDLAQLHNILGDTYVCTQMSVTNGEFVEPLKRIHFYSKDNPSGPVDPPDLPQLSLDLPFYKLQVFCRDKCEDFSDVKGKVEDFLRNKNALRK